MSRRIQKELEELRSAGVITSEIAEHIQAYYQDRDAAAPNRLYIAFGILGALLVGLGLILIIAHNWDQFPRATKTILAFIPLILGQGGVLFTLLKRKEAVAWKEGSGTFLYFAVGACMAMISQIYNIPGDISDFLLTWMLLIVPLIYVLRSSIVSLLYLAGITYFAGEVGYWKYPVGEPYLYWGLLLLAVPHYYWLLRNRPKSNFTTFHNWLVPLSVIAVLGTISDGSFFIMFATYMSLFGVLYLIGQLDFFNRQKLRNNGYLILGSTGMLVLLLVGSFSAFWEAVGEESQKASFLSSPHLWAIALLVTLAIFLLFISGRQGKGMRSNPINLVFALYLLLFLLGQQLPGPATILINFLVFLMGVFTINRGTEANHLGILNYGLLIITALIFCRFFDTNLSFVLRGLLLMAVGVGFFLFNSWFLKKRRGEQSVS